MDYSSTGTDLHLQEYINTGPGPAMIDLAKWAGLPELTNGTQKELPEYKPEW